jgi:hypothetical protein
MLTKINYNALGGVFSFTAAPATWASPNIAIASHKVNQIAKGGQGDTPLGLPPPLGERGGLLRIFLSQRKDKQNQVFYRAPFLLSIHEASQASRNEDHEGKNNRFCSHKTWIVFIIIALYLYIHNPSSDVENV